MSKCWNEYPKDRPNFENLKELLWEILGSEEITPVCQEKCSKGNVEKASN